MIKNRTIVIIGSHSIDLRKSNEKLPGRRGETSDVYDKIMLPMKFSDIEQGGLRIDLGIENVILPL